MTISKRGGPNRGQGRKPLAQNQRTVMVAIKMTEGQRDRLKALGGSKWVRFQIDKGSENE
jgi:hypothetical protein